MDVSAGNGQADISLSVRKAQVEQLYRQTRGGLIGALVVAPVACFILLAVIPVWKLATWLGILFLVTAARVLLAYFFFSKSPDADSISKWGNLHGVFSALSALTWGMAPFLLWPENQPVYQLVWPICIVSISAAAVLMYSTWKTSFLPFVFLSSMLIALRMILVGGLPYILIGILGFAFCVFLGVTGWLMYKDQINTLRIGLENEALNKILSEEKHTVQTLNTKLQREIEQHKRAQEELQVKNEKLKKLNNQLTSTTDHLESANRELAEALSNVKQLSGMLPICASCKKIRNDKGYWEQLEAYLYEHSNAQFSHGICPDCIEKLYPEYAK